MVYIWKQDSQTEVWRPIDYNLRVRVSRNCENN